MQPPSPDTLKNCLRFQIWQKGKESTGRTVLICTESEKEMTELRKTPLRISRNYFESWDYSLVLLQGFQSVNYLSCLN